MVRRTALASAYTLFVVTLLSMWPMSYVRWLVIVIPFYWAWVAFGLENKQARRTGIAASVVLFVACFLLISYQDMTSGPLCLWHSGNCGSSWFN